MNATPQLLNLDLLQVSVVLAKPTVVVLPALQEILKPDPIQVVEVIIQVNQVVNQVIQVINGDFS